MYHFIRILIYYYKIYVHKFSMRQAVFQLIVPYFLMFSCILINFLISSKSINACIHPQSKIFFSNHSKLTGFVRKSLQPSAKAFFLSDDKDDAVSATMITGGLVGDD